MIAGSSELKDIYLDNSDSKIFCKVGGKGNPLIVIHGGPGLSSDYLLPQMSELSKNNFVIFYDQRGCGRSIGVIEPNTINIETFLSEIELIRKSFKYEKVSVLGHSWGGFLAMQYAIAYPNHVHKLILSNTIPASSDDMFAFIKEWMVRMEPYQSEISRLRSDPGFRKADPSIMEQFYRVTYRTYFYNHEKGDLLNLRMTQQACLNRQKVYDLVRENILGKPFDFHLQLSLLKNNTLILHGDKDPVPSFAIENIYKSIPKSKYILMKNCGHFPYVEDPIRYFALIDVFLNEE